MKIAIYSATLALASLMSTLAHADYPERPINFIVQSSAGGGSDIFARAMSTTLLELGLINEPFLIEHRAGGSGVVAYNYISGRSGNSYTIGTGGSNFYTTPLMGQSPVTWEDFTPVAALARDPYVLTVNPNSSIESAEDIQAMGTVLVGSTGVVTDPSFLAGMLEEDLGVEARIVPFGGGGEVLAALLGGHIDIYFANPSEALSQIQSGNLRPIAVSADQRLDVLPDVPTFQELGHDIELSIVRGIFMPGDVAQEDVEALEDILRQLSESDEWNERYMERYNLIPYFLPHDEYLEHMEETNEFYRSMMVRIGVIN